MKIDGRIVWDKKHNQNYRLSHNNKSMDVIDMHCYGDKTYYLQKQQIQLVSFKKLIETRQLVVVG
jgi:hypothetical protein